MSIIICDTSDFEVSQLHLSVAFLCYDDAMCLIEKFGGAPIAQVIRLHFQRRDTGNWETNFSNNFV